jgi:uncharacterized protein (DUF1330 family)
VSTVTFHDLTWVDAYQRNVPAMISAHGGRYLFKPCRPVMRQDGEIQAIIEFPSAEAARVMLASEAYRPYAEARRKGASTRIQLLC